MTTKHTLVALVEDKPGVLTRMASLFRRRGFNIESIVVGRSELPHLSRMTIVISGSTAMVEQLRKQLDKVINVEKIDSLCNLLRGFGIKEMTRTGRIAMTRGSPRRLPVEKGPSEAQGK
jgi:acetolactate synthase small subunit